MQPNSDEPFLGRPILSNRRCPNCETRLIATPRWHREADGSGWMWFSIGCAYLCVPTTAGGSDCPGPGPTGSIATLE